jgi:uncharacterized protein (DUF2147 family)
MKKILIAMALLLGGNLMAQSADDILGKWWNEEKDGQVEIYKVGTEYRGRVVYVKFNTNPDGTSPKNDNLNPEPALRKRVIEGLTILRDLRFNSSKKEWSGGEIYDTKSGNTYECFCKLQDDGTLFFKGHIKLSRMLGRSTTWTRVE